MRHGSVKNVVATGIGAALFFVLARFVAVPSGIPNTTITFQYAAQAVFSILYGPVVGCLSGFIGHVLCDMSWGGVWWTWAFATGVYGLIVGMFSKKINIADGNFSKDELTTFIIANLIANFTAWGLIAPLGDVFIYKEDPRLVFTQGLIAGTGDFLFAVVIGGLLLYGFAKTTAKAGSLDKE